MNVPQFAALAHKGQFRRDGITPYIEHPKAVASFFEEESLAWEVAWLHDVLEDSEISTQNLLDAGIKKEVVFYVSLLTHHKSEPYLDYIQRLAYGGGISRKVKLADIFTNLADSPTDRQKEKYKKALAILLNA